MRVVALLRCSTQDQASSGLGLDAQEKRVRAYAELYGLEIAEVVVDAGVSGKTLDRPGLKRALGLLESGEVSGLLVAKLDRLTRSVRDLGELVERYFADGRFALLSVGENVDTRSAAGRLVLNVLGAVAQWERETIVERTKDAMAAKRARGEALGGAAPFGQAWRDGALVEEPAEQAILALVDELRRGGMTLGEVALELKARGVVSPRTQRPLGATALAKVARRAARQCVGAAS